jgi:hypothetical protein
MDDMDPLKFRCIPRPKDFADFADYFVRKVGRCLRPPSSFRFSDQPR